MAFPTGTVTEDNLNAVTDSPALARADLLLTVQKLNLIIGSFDSASGIAALDSGGRIASNKLPNSLISSASANLTLNPDTGVLVINDLIQLNPKTVTQLNALTGVEGQVAYCTNGANGSKCLAVYNGTAWKVVSLEATISAT
tara:strand:- start:257 stop:682 length:426 start_codon:yes stop_codon:yes gene_type:complete